MPILALQSTHLILLKLAFAPDCSQTDREFASLAATGSTVAAQSVRGR